jgi:hypothetical protein
MNTTSNEPSNENETHDSRGSNAGTRVAGLGAINVTTTIIDTAVPKNSGHCMVSDAVTEAARKKGWRIGKVLTDLQTVRFSDLQKKVRYVCFTPRVAQEALLAFDKGMKPEPFSFRLRPVQIITKVQGIKRPRRRLATTKPKASGGQARPIIHGGSALPTMIGLRREFGLRQMGVWQAPEPAPASN